MYKIKGQWDVVKMHFIYQGCEKEIPKITGHGQSRSWMTFLDGGVDGFSYFSLIFSYFIFYPESSLIYNLQMSYILYFPLLI